jgi:hypothetical protein
MAGRPMGKMHQEDVRAKIRTSQLINRLENHALGELELSATQIKAIEVLIRKTLPDLSAVTLKSDGDNAVQITVVELIAPPMKQLPQPEIQLVGHESTH